MPGHRRTCSLIAFAVSMCLVLCGVARADLIEVDDQALSDTAAYGLLWTDKITGSELAGSNAYSTPFTFYRMGLDAQLATNMNIARAQLGCGGVNDLLSPGTACDIDAEYMALMGRNGLNAGNPLSALVLERPYIELAIKNDGTANREMAGFKLGGQSVDGAMVVGRRYTSNGVNQENSMDWNQPPMEAASWNIEPYRVAGTNCNTATDLGNGVVGCHSGINSISGFLGTEMSLTMRVITRVCVFICIGIDEWGCVGRTAHTSDVCGNTKADAFFMDVAGTRMPYLGLRNARLLMTDNPLIDLLGGKAFASLNADLRLAHQVIYNKTGDFFISFQREPIAYPRFSKMTPKAEMAALNPSFESNAVVDYLPGDERFMDACATTRWDTARCTSAYAVPANTGWWLNAPTAKLLNIVNNSVNLPDLDLGQALQLLGPPGLVISQPELQFTPAKNCYGATRFC